NFEMKRALVRSEDNYTSTNLLGKFENESRFGAHWSPFQFRIIHYYVHIISTKQEIGQSLLQGILLFRIRLLFSPSRSEEFRVLHDIISEFIEMLDNIWQPVVTGNEIGHETANRITHRIISELPQLLQRPSIQIVDLFPCLVKRRSHGVSALIILLLHTGWKRIEFLLTHRITINDRDYCDAQLGHS